MLEIPVKRRGVTDRFSARQALRDQTLWQMKKAPAFAGASRIDTVRCYGRFVFALRFTFAFMFVLPRFAFVFMLVFILLIGVLVAIGVGVDKLVFRFVRLALLTALFVPVSPQAIPSAPRAKTAVSAIFFIILFDLLSSSKIKTDCLTANSPEGLFCPNLKDNLEQTPL